MAAVNDNNRDVSIAFCGLNCRKCDAYVATVNNDRALREKTARLWSELNHVLITPGQINCEGCRADGTKTVFCSELCGIRKCAIEKGVETCGACASMDSCSLLGAIVANNEEARGNLTRNGRD